MGSPTSRSATERQTTKRRQLSRVVLNDLMFLDIQSTLTLTSRVLRLANLLSRYNPHSPDDALILAKRAAIQI
jgi:predicted nucleic acid-binding protein